MFFVNIHDAKTHLSQYIQYLSDSDGKIVLCRNGKPVAELVKYQDQPKRNLGIWKNKVYLAPDFDELPDDFMQNFE